MSGTKGVCVCGGGNFAVSDLSWFFFFLILCLFSSHCWSLSTTELSFRERQNPLCPSLTLKTLPGCHRKSAVTRRQKIIIIRKHHPKPQNFLALVKGLAQKLQPSPDCHYALQLSLGFPVYTKIIFSASLFSKVRTMHPI